MSAVTFLPQAIRVASVLAVPAVGYLATKKAISTFYPLDLTGQYANTLPFGVDKAQIKAMTKTAHIARYALTFLFATVYTMAAFSLFGKLCTVLTGQDLLISPLYPIVVAILSATFMNPLFLSWCTKENRAAASLPPPPRLEDVAGLGRAKEIIRNLAEDILNSSPNLPTGILLFGPPGTGKTLLAQTLATEADCNYLYVPATQFTKGFAGQGAEEIRSIFRQAREKAEKTGKKTILVIDEIDTVAAKRASSHSQASDIENNGKVNALLTCIDAVRSDGQSRDDSVIVVGITNNRPILDLAIVRPGRLEKHIHIDLPNQEERLEYLQIATRGLNLAPDVNLREIAAISGGTTCATLKSAINDAISAARRENGRVSQPHLLRALRELQAPIEGAHRQPTPPTAEELARQREIDRAKEIVRNRCVIRQEWLDSLKNRLRLANELALLVTSAAYELQFCGECSRLSLEDLKLAREKAKEMCDRGLGPHGIRAVGRMIDSSQSNAAIDQLVQAAISRVTALLNQRIAAPD